MAWEDHAALKVAQELGRGGMFSFTFDFGDGRRHRCRVLRERVDPREEYG